MTEREKRAFLWGVAASVVFHALLFFAIPVFRDAARRMQSAPVPLVARLVEPAPPAALPPVAAERPEPPPKPKPAVTEPAPQAAKPPPAPKARARAKPAAPRAPEPPAPQAEEAVPAAPAVSAPPVQAPKTPQPPATASAAPHAIASPLEPPTNAPDPGSLARYRIELTRTAVRFKRYPRSAMDNNWEGTAEIALAIGPNGELASVTIKQSTGHAVLDQQAIDMFTKAKPLVPIPPALRGKEFSVVLKAIYSLREPDA